MAGPAHADPASGVRGCHLNRPIDDLVRGAGLELSQLQNFSAKGPKVFGYMFEGVATKA